MNQIEQPQPNRTLWTRLNVQEVDYFGLPIYEHFNGQPLHICKMRQRWNMAKVLKDFRSKVIRSRQILDSASPGGEQDGVRSLLLQLTGEVYCLLEGHTLFIYAPDPETAREHGRQFLERYAKPSLPEEPRFHLLSFNQGTVEIRAVEVVKPFVLSDEDLALHYGASAPEFERYLIESWASQVASVTIFRGPPGTGKTSFIRHLISKRWKSHRFYYLPINACRYLSSPDMVEFWLGINGISTEYKKILVLEDAEDLLMQRGSDNQAKVSAVLNIADGLLGEFLQLHLICTVNCPLDKLDPAITRPGRLLAVREFRRLDREQAERLAAEKTIALAEQQDYSLAEIYRPRQWRDDRAVMQPRIGFSTGFRRRDGKADAQ